MADIYIMRACGVDTDSVLYPPERQLQVESTANEKLKISRIASWQALASGLRHSFGRDMRSVGFYRDGMGVWRCDDDGIRFSLSHSGGFAAAAVSGSDIGADIELVEDGRSAERRAAVFNKIRTDGEAESFSPEQLLRLWTKKESIFKYSRRQVFRPSEIETSLFPVKTYIVPSCGLIVSVCCRDNENRFYECLGDGVLPLRAESI